MNFIRTIVLRPVWAVALAGAIAALSVLFTAFAQSAGAQEADRTVDSSGTKPTIVVVHGAFADASSWDGVIERLQDAGYPELAGTANVRAMAQHALAQIVEVRASHVAMISHPDAVVRLIRTAANSVH